MAEREIKVKSKSDRPPEHPLYRALTQQIGAALDIAREIKRTAKGDTPNFVHKFLDEFDKKAA